MKSGDTARIYGQLFPRDVDGYWEMYSTLAKSLEEQHGSCVSPQYSGLT
jgi:hypothetical protein